MRKTLLSVLSVLLVLVALCGCGSDSPESIRRDFDELRQQMEKVEHKSEEYYEVFGKWADICERIAKGNKDSASEYAEVLRVVTNGEVIFEDEDVFARAQECKELFRWVADGKEDGVLEIGIKKNKDGANVLYIEGLFLDDYQYSVVDVSLDTTENTANGTVEYDGALGQYRLCISIGDAKLSEDVFGSDRYGKVHNVELAGVNGQYKWRAQPVSDSTTYIYVGSDTPWPAQVAQNGSFELARDSIEIELP